mmetsp:Transcript_13198/g.37145  ORF Transcript_13198/g.37145 Transcript_13198/m.37145 type:complete len:129 (+) Transcript_13198:1741-2127(+)
MLGEEVLIPSLSSDDTEDKEEIEAVALLLALVSSPLIPSRKPSHAMPPPTASFVSSDAPIDGKQYSDDPIFGSQSTKIRFCKIRGKDFCNLLINATVVVLTGFERCVCEKGKATKEKEAGSLSRYGTS